MSLGSPYPWLSTKQSRNSSEGFTTHVLLLHYFIPWSSFRIFWPCCHCDFYKFQVLITVHSLCPVVVVCHPLSHPRFTLNPVPCLSSRADHLSVCKRDWTLSLLSLPCRPWLFPPSETLILVLSRVSTHPSILPMFTLNATPWLVPPQV